MWFFFSHYNFPKHNQSSQSDKDGDDLNDSIWAMVAGFVKSFNVPFEVALEMPYVNLIMYSQTLPSYDYDNETTTDNNKGKVITDKAEYNAYIRKLAGK